MVVDNSTGRTLNVAPGCGNGFDGLLGNSRYQQGVVSDLMCAGPIFIRPGVNRIPVIFDATYDGCCQYPSKSNPADPSDPACIGGDVIPPLPVGTYVAWVDGGGAELPVPQPVTVHLVAPAGADKRP